MVCGAGKDLGHTLRRGEEGLPLEKLRGGKDSNIRGGGGLGQSEKGGESKGGDTEGSMRIIPT